MVIDIFNPIIHSPITCWSCLWGFPRQLEVNSHNLVTLSLQGTHNRRLLIRNINSITLALGSLLSPSLKNSYYTCILFTSHEVYEISIRKITSINPQTNELKSSSMWPHTKYCCKPIDIVSTNKTHCGTIHFLEISKKSTWFHQLNDLKWVSEPAHMQNNNHKTIVIVTPWTC